MICLICEEVDHDQKNCPTLDVEEEEKENDKKNIVKKSKRRVKNVCTICKEINVHDEKCPNLSAIKKKENEMKGDENESSSSEEESYMIPRHDHLREKRGNKEDGTDAAHILSFQVMEAIIKDIQMLTRQDLDKLSAFLNRSFNLRIKSVKGNRSIDKKLDNEIVSAFSTGSTLTSPAFARARRQVRILLRAKKQIKDRIIQKGLEMYEKLTNRTKKSVLDNLEKDLGSDEEFPPEYWIGKHSNQQPEKISSPPSYSNA
jgi:hypothetical protein